MSQSVVHTNSESVPRRTPGIRSLMDSLVCLAIAVALFRAFEVEGYIISTGSMAPNLRGYHKQIVCPVCQTKFAHGVAYEAAGARQSTVSVRSVDDPFSTSFDRTRAVCPNCGEPAIDISEVPQIEGDQLLVFKNAFAFERPRRWEVVVFQNPNQPTEAYVKRVVGLPGEQIQIVDGDVYANGIIQRKSLLQQRGICIPVYDQSHAPPPGGNWQSRWQTEGPWQAVGPGFSAKFADVRTERGSLASPAWLTYRHWIRAGGNQQTSVALTAWPEEIEVQMSPFYPLAFDAAAHRLTCTGVLPTSLCQQLLAQSDSESFSSAIQELASLSHIASVSDFYGYNRPIETTGRHTVRDLLLDTQITIHRGSGRLLFQFADEQGTYTAGIDIGASAVWVDAGGLGQRRKVTRLPDFARAGVFHLEISNIDRQLLLAMNGEELLTIPLEEVRRQDDRATTEQRVGTPSFSGLESVSHVDNPALGDEIAASASAGAQAADRRPIGAPVRIGVQGLDVRLETIKLFRDVYYTRGGGRNGIDRACRLADDEYFMLGDNSPVSLDSRSWKSPGVKTHMLIGKPLVVHLPSRPGRIQIGNYVGHIRIPDFSRIRYIR